MVTRLQRSYCDQGVTIVDTLIGQSGTFLLYWGDEQTSDEMFIHQLAGRLLLSHEGIASLQVKSMRMSRQGVRRCASLTMWASRRRLGSDVLVLALEGASKVHGRDPCTG